eukprot:gnl/Dysnectes_brevis/8307_a14653_333.p1 GENE.gnl/Dysnectes_brevis/8307_a14653_333~~gnl/Dysnectes_brevis/8307_a14653_333.p1  ORF type:complete len:122 (+),score=6.07 gnl/Dysnectes_brevis/8307_a14653_333:249-614(+)
MTDTFSEDDIRFMEAAIQEGEKALEEREVPIGCVFVRNGEIIAKGHNLTNALNDATQHAELVAIEHHSLTNLEDLTLYVTVEPCLMCTGALAMLRLKHCVFGASNDKFGGCRSVFSLGKHV